MEPGGAAGPAELRAESLTAALEVADAVFATSGGDHAHEILEHLDRDRLAASVGWFVGTSDNSMVAVALASAGVTAFCGPDMKVSTPELTDPRVGDARPLDFAYTRAEVAALFDRAGSMVDIELPAGPSGVALPLRAGDAAGPLVAVNLRCLLKLTRLPQWWPASLLDGSVLLVEAFHADAGEFAQMLAVLAATGALDRVAALGIGWLHGVQGPEGCGRFDVVADAALSLTSPSTPVYQLGVFGHRCPHAVLPVGEPAALVDGKLSVSWPTAPR